MGYRVCLTPGCPRLGQWQRGRCPDHDRAHDRARGTRQARGYDAHHDRLRAHYQGRMDRGEMFVCWRPECGRPIDPNLWHLGHDDHDRSTIRGVECITCNLSAAGRARHGLQPRR